MKTVRLVDAQLLINLLRKGEQAAEEQLNDIQEDIKASREAIASLEQTLMDTTFHIIEGGKLRMRHKEAMNILASRERTASRLYARVQAIRESIALVEAHAIELHVSKPDTTPTCEGGEITPC